MKKIIVTACLFVSFACNDKKPNDRPSSEYISTSGFDGFRATELHISGMHYKVLTGYKIGMAVVNVTKDSLECIALQNNIKIIAKIQ